MRGVWRSKRTVLGEGDVVDNDLLKHFDVC